MKISRNQLLFIVVSFGTIILCGASAIIFILLRCKRDGEYAKDDSVSEEIQEYRPAYQRITGYSAGDRTPSLQEDGKANTASIAKGIETQITFANMPTDREYSEVVTDQDETDLELNTPTVVYSTVSKAHLQYIENDSQQKWETEECLNSATCDIESAPQTDCSDSTSHPVEGMKVSPKSHTLKRKRDSSAVEIVTEHATAGLDVTFRAPKPPTRGLIPTKHGPDNFPIMMASGVQRGRLPKIPSEATKLLHSMKQQNYQTVLFTRYGVDFYPPMIQRLHDGGNLDVGTVEAYLRMIIHGRSNIFVFPTRNVGDAITVSISDELRRAELVFFPLLDRSDESLSLAVLDRRRKTLFSYGAHGKKVLESRSSLIPIQNWMEQAGLDHDNWWGWSVGLAPQRHQLIYLKKDRDSGVYLLINAHHLARGKAPRHYSANDIPYHRLRIAYELAIGALL